MKNNISVITINFNNKSGLEDTIKSVINQTYSNVEYIVIDGGSVDGSVEIVKQNQSKINYWISEKDRGVYHAMNKGIAKATGDYLIFLNSGDVFTTYDTLTICCGYIKQIPDMDIYYGDIVAINHKELSNKSLFVHPEKLTLEFFRSNTINHQASLINTNLFKEFGYYPEIYKLAADYWLWLKSLLNNKKFRHLGFPMVVYDFSGISAANNFKIYGLERDLIWQRLVPESIQDILYKNDQCKQLVEYRIIKAAVWLNSIYQRFKN